jgi:putative heme-binding domain-containing protein
MTQRLNCLLILFIACSFSGKTCRAVSASVGFEVPNGFEVSVAADDRLVHDAFSMTLDAKGRPVVSGPGYVRTLIDDDSDGTFDRYVTWSSLPKNGAQGLWADEGAVYWVGDGGLWKSSDKNGDLVGDGPPTRVLALPTGGEHDAHAIRRGPDGWWYLIAGNFANDIDRLSNTPDSIVTRPRAGTLWRISPDFSQRVAWAHGFRNAYDFDFAADGRIVTFDSDEEREVSLPWYRPTRVLVVSPGCDAGWVDSAWFDQDDRITMPEVISKLGRGSPTGVAVYRHFAFPTKYRDAAFVLDWTFGRVIAVYPQVVEDEKKPKRFMAETFMQSSGINGFAPTDICVAPDGGLLVCVGGRGTSGAVYRVVYTSVEGLATNQPRPISNLVSIADSDERLAAALEMPCPWESWSTSEWRKALASLPANSLSKVLTGATLRQPTEGRLSDDLKQRACQYAAFLGINLEANAMKAAYESSRPATRSSAAWYWGRSSPKQIVAPDFSTILSTGLTEGGGLYSAWDELLGGTLERELFEAIGLRRERVPFAFSELDSVPEDWQIRRSARRAYLWSLSRQTKTLSSIRTIATGQSPSDYDTRVASTLFGGGAGRIEADLMDRLARRVSAKELGMKTDRLLEALTVVQISLGDLRHHVPGQQAPSRVHALDGYRAMYANSLSDPIREGWARFCSALAKLDTEDSLLIRNEALRTLAMLESKSAEAVAICLDGINEDSHPTSDLHHLAVLACCRAPRTVAQSEATALALMNVIRKSTDMEISTDSRWNTRLEELFRELTTKDPQLAEKIVSSKNSPAVDRLMWIEWCPSDLQSIARKELTTQLLSSEVKTWEPALVRFAAGSSPDNQLVEKLRTADFPSDPSLRIELLAARPAPSDYRIMLDQLDSPHRLTWPYAWKVVSRLPIEEPSREFGTLAIFWTKLAQSPMAEISAASIVNRLRLVASRLKLTGIPQRESYESWLPFLQNNLEVASRAKLESLRGSAASWRKEVESMGELSGTASNGEKIFVRAKCSQCHGSGNALGPNLAGVTRRFSRDDLFQAIYEPNRDVPDRYRALKILNGDGEVFVGMKVYDSVDGVTLQTADGKVVRINREDIENKSISDVSLMPGGLLDGLSRQELADLHAYLRSL